MSNMLVARRYGDETISSENVANENSVHQIKLNLSNRWRVLTVMRILINLVELCSYIVYLSLWPSGIGSHLGRNRLWVRFLAKSDIYPMFNCSFSLITWVLSGFSGYIWLDAKIDFKKRMVSHEKHSIPDYDWHSKDMWPINIFSPIGTILHN